MLSFVHVTYSLIYNSTAGSLYGYTGWAFDTVALTMQQVSGQRSVAILDPRPVDVWLNTGDLLWWTCSATTATKYLYERNGETFTVVTEANSGLCGYTPPNQNTPSCTLLIVSVTPSYDQATVDCSTFIGPLQYSLDGGITRQTSNIFTGLSVGQYTVTVFDLGATLLGCRATQTFSISASAPAGALATIDQLPGFCFAGNPVVLNMLAAAPYHHVIVQVWVETAHRSGNFIMAYQAKRRSNVQAAVSMDVQDVLSAYLDHQLDVGTQWRELVGSARSWFVRVASVLPQTGQASTWVTSTNSVVLLGGLAPEPLQFGADYFTTARLRRIFHTWQPLNKKVGPQHMELLSFLVADAQPLSVRVKSYDETGALQGTDLLPVPPAAAASTPQNAVIPPPLVSVQACRFMQLVLHVYRYPGAARLVIDVIDQATANPATDPALNWPRTLDVVDTEPRQLVYQNSLGTYDTLALFGKMSAKLTIDPAQVEAYLLNEKGQPTDRYTKTWPGQPTVQGNTLSTGWISPEWLENLQELVQPGRDVYEYANDRLRAVVLTTTELPTYLETDDQRQAVIEYRPAAINPYFSDYARNTNRSASVGAGW